MLSLVDEFRASILVQTVATDANVIYQGMEPEFDETSGLTHQPLELSEKFHGRFTRTLLFRYQQSFCIKKQRLRKP